PGQPAAVASTMKSLAILTGLLAGLLVPAAAGAQAPPHRLEPQDVAVRVEGVEGALAANVRTVLEIARAADTGRISLDRAVRLHRTADADIETALQPFGYYRPRIRKSLREEGEGLVARYAIDPGPAVILTRVSVTVSGEGSRDSAFARLTADYPLSPGDTLRHLPYDAAKLALITLAADSGYLRARFDTSLIRVDRERSTAEIIVAFDTGPRFRFGPVRRSEEHTSELQSREK